MGPIFKARNNCLPLSADDDKDRQPLWGAGPTIFVCPSLKAEVAHLLGNWEAFRQGRFQIDCCHMELASPRWVYRGPGQISQDAHGTLTFKVHCPSEPANSLGETLRRVSRARAGKLTDEADLFALTATAYNGAVWRSDGISPEPNHYLTTGSTIVSGKLSRLRQERENSRKLGSEVKLTFFGQDLRDWEALYTEEVTFGAPYTGYTMRCAAGNEGDVSVSIRTPVTFPENFWFRASEALSFVLAKVLRASVIEQVHSGKRVVTLYSPVPRSRTRQFPPIRTDWRKNHAEVARMLERYLQFVQNSELKDFWHPCSAHLSHACEASANSFDAWAVGLCVAFEGIAGLVPHEKSFEQTQAISEIKRVAKTWVKRRAYPTDLQARVSGLLGQLDQARVKDRLRPLIDGGYFDPKHLRSWEGLRHKRVHGAKFQVSDFDDPEIQKVLDAIFSSQVGMYQIIFFLIGYQGLYSGYSKAEDNFAFGTYPLRTDAPRPG